MLKTDFIGHKLSKNSYIKFRIPSVIFHFRIKLFINYILIFLNSCRFSWLTPENLTEEYLSPLTAKHFVPFMAYNDTKLCNTVIANELDRRWSREEISCNSVHPGNMVSTDISRHWWFYKLLFFLVRPYTKSLVSLKNYKYCYLLTLNRYIDLLCLPFLFSNKQQLLVVSHF